MVHSRRRFLRPVAIVFQILSAGMLGEGLRLWYPYWLMSFLVAALLCSIVHRRNVRVIMIRRSLLIGVVIIILDGHCGCSIDVLSGLSRWCRIAYIPLWWVMWGCWVACRAMRLACWVCLVYLSTPVTYVPVNVATKLLFEMSITAIDVHFFINLELYPHSKRAYHYRYFAGICQIEKWNQPILDRPVRTK